MRRRKCACGGYVTADWFDPTPGVRKHQAAEPHRSWADRMYGARRKPTVGPLTVDRLRELGLAPKA